MALTVEDGTGLASADAYISVAEFTSFCSARNYVGWDEYGITDFEGAIRNATSWIDTYQRYKAIRLLPTQALEFPRTGLVDWSGYAVTGVPQRVKQACAELAFKALSQSLYQDMDRGGMVSSESVGAISVSYEAGAPTGKVWQLAVNLLKPFVRDPNSDPMPMHTSAGGPYFSTGMHDNPGNASDLLAPDVG